MLNREKLQKFWTKVRILPLLILVASLAFMVRLGDAYTNARQLSGSAVAEETAAAEPAEKSENSQKSEEPKTAVDATAEASGTEPPDESLKTEADVKSEAEAKNTTPQEEDQAAEGADAVDLPSMDEDKTKKWEDAADTDTEFPEIKKEMYDDLVKRREELDAREKKLSEREALMDAAQKEIDRKYKEMEGLRDEIQGLLKQQTDAESARLDSLVKIYSGMKPKDAARIFNTLDMDVLLEVIGKMPEGKSSPILAAMDAERARALTTMLAEQKKLPEAP